MRILSQEFADIRREVAVTWVPSRVRALSTEEILSELAAKAVPYDPDRFLETSQKESSAWEVAERLWPTQMNRNTEDSDFLGLAACVLWERLDEAGKMDYISLEMLDDLIQDGYQYEPHSPEKACEIWLRAWYCMKNMFPPSCRTLEEIDNEFRGSQLLANLCSDMEMAVVNASIDNRDMAHMGIQFLEDFLAEFPHEDDLLLGNFRMSLAELYCRVTNQDAGEELMREEMKNFPRKTRGYVGMEAVLSYRSRNGRPPAYAEQLQVLERARKNRVTDGEDFDLTLRIEELKCTVGDLIEKGVEEISTEAVDRKALLSIRKRMQDGAILDKDFDIITKFFTTLHLRGKLQETSDALHKPS